MVAVAIDRASIVPVYLQIKYQVLYEIAIGRLRPGDRLPSIRRLAVELGITPTTVRHAYDALAGDGVVVAQHGSGVRVAEFTVGSAVASDRRPPLHGLLRPTIDSARAAGYTAAEIRDAVAMLLGAARRTVVLVSPDRLLMERYEPMLPEVLEGTGVEIMSLLLSDLRSATPAVRSTLQHACCIATFIRSYAEVRDHLAEVTVPIVGLAVELAADTQAELLTLPRSARAVLVAERISLSGMAHLVDQYWLPDPPLRPVELESPHLASEVRTANVIVHSLRARPRLEGLAQPQQHLVELRYVLNRHSAVQLRQTVESPANGTSSESQTVRT